jgi:hypothetical protein
MSLGIGLACIYLLPALTTQEFVSLGDLLPELYHQRWPQLTNFNRREFDGRITLAVLTTAIVTACAAILACRRRGSVVGDDDAAGDAAQRSRRRERTFWIVVSLGCLLLMTPASGFVWRLVKPLQSIQFPWRFNAVLCVAAAALAAPAADTLRRRGSRGALNLALLCVALALVVYWVFFTHSIVRRAQPEWRGDAPALDADFVKRYARMRDAPEYRPATAASTQAVAFDELMSRICRAGERPAKVCTVAGEGEIAVERWTPGEIKLRVATASGVAFDVTQFHYPGWAAYLDGRRHPLEPSRPDGLLHLDVPAGEHQIILRLRHTAAVDAGILLSAASVILLMLWVAARIRYGRRQKRAAAAAAVA